jgi:glycosyltransferase involved in cell wall biosynthesis
MRILFITNIPPLPSWGSAMTFHRHFCERKDFTISVITGFAKIKDYEVSYPYLFVSRGWLWTKISKTRFYQWAHTWSLLVGCLFIPANVLKHARQFKPDAIFTVAGSWSWTAILAQKVAKKLNVPLIGSFNDWWFYNILYHPTAANLVEKKFLRFYKDCDLALCTSEGMREALGEHRNAVILYPTGSLIKDSEISIPTARLSESIFTVAFAGNLGDWYGKMLESLVRASTGSDIRFKFFGSNASWTEAFDQYVKKEQIFKGQVSFDKLSDEMKQVDVLLLLMGFDESDAIVEKTSFKTKFLDYLSFRKPILLWGPSYCSAVAIASEFKSAEICTSHKPEDFIHCIHNIKNNEPIRKILISNAYNMYQQRFNPDTIHTILKAAIMKLKK